MIVFSDPSIMRRLQFVPCRCLLEVVVSHALLDSKRRFDVRLPRLSYVNGVFRNAELGVELQNLLRMEYAATIADNPVGTSMTNGLLLGTFVPNSNVAK
jgi:hypothetical protein